MLLLITFSKKRIRGGRVMKQIKGICIKNRNFDKFKKLHEAKGNVTQCAKYPLNDIFYTVDIDADGNHHNFQAHSIEDLPEDYLPAEDSYYEFEPEDINKE